jgi:hypothetical protein
VGYHRSGKNSGSSALERCLSRSQAGTGRGDVVDDEHGFVDERPSGTQPSIHCDGVSRIVLTLREREPDLVDPSR